MSMTQRPDEESKVTDETLRKKEARIGKLETLVLFVAGLVPLLWLRPQYIIAKGDDFPFWLIPNRTMTPDTFLWAIDNVGHAAVNSTSLIYEFLWFLARTIGLSVSSSQILFQVLFFLVAGSSMRYLARIVYPQFNAARIVSSSFYMFNFFVIQSRDNIGFSWTYAFLPLLIGLLIRTLEGARSRELNVNKTTVYFGIASAVTLSFASINPANVAIVLLTLAVVVVYYLLSSRGSIRRLLWSIDKLAGVSLAINIWWVIPVLNYYLVSPAILEAQASATAWSWTTARASFLNLFWLNGVWGWRPEYVPYIGTYSSPILVFFVFVPFLLASAALLFKTHKSLFNSYLMVVVLAMVFLAKGLHEPFSGANLLLYNYIPLIDVFREPVSKFTMAIIPFLALLIGYSGHHLANLKLGRFKPTAPRKILTVAFLIAIFIVAAFPLVTNPIETKTPQLPFSSYVAIPNYWYQATDWLNAQPGNNRILITPGDDYYQMPYSWGYYGTDSFMDRLIQKPTLSSYYLSSYKTNPNTTLTLQQVYNSMKYNRTSDFRGFLDLLSVKYILQRNDVYYNLTGRQIMSPDDVRSFLTQQPYIHLVSKFGQLDIYQYADAKPYVYVLDPIVYQSAIIRIENDSVSSFSWNFSSSADLADWQKMTPTVQFGAIQELSLNAGALEADLWNSTWGWKTIDSPLIPAVYGETYQFGADIKGLDAYQVHVKIAEYDANKTITIVTYEQFINDGTFDWTHALFLFQPTTKSTSYLQMEIWNGHNTDKPLPNTVWVRNVKVKSFITRLNAEGLDGIFNDPPQSTPAIIQGVDEKSPTQITVSVNASRPFILALSQTLDPSWIIHANGRQLEPLPLYLGLAGVYVDMTGQIAITIEYIAQTFFYYGAVTSIVTIVVSIAYLINRSPRLKSRGRNLIATLRRRIAAFGVWCLET